ncbi:MAG: hypothetical protein IKE69_03310, partial [Thermoguttaceae bacterium]|nr:hypothetical protein [Thermoguttaceae bacterium]
DVTVTVNSASFADKNVGTGKAVSVDFTASGADAGNYAIRGAAATANITKAALTVTFTADDKVYDGTTDAAISDYALSGLVEGDEVAIAVDSASFADKNVGAAKTVTVNYTASGADAGNYAIAAAAVSADITAKQLTVSGTTVADKVYDGNTDATIRVGTLEGVVAGDEVALGYSGAFPSAEVGAYDVTVSYTISGADAANYLAPAADTVRASITPDSFVITFEDAEYVYNAASRSIEVSGAAATDVVLYSLDGETYSAEIPQFTNVGSYTVYAKVSRENYADWTGSAVLTITPAEITVTTTASDKVYDGTTVATLATVVTGIIAGDDVTVTVEGAFADRNVGEEKTVNLVNVLRGAQAGNYTLVANSTATADITAKTLTATTAAESKVYDGATDAEATLRSVTGKVAGDDVTVTIASASFADKNVGASKAVTAVYTLSGADAGNYVVDDGDVTADITAKTLTVNFTAENKVYDGTTDATATFASFDGLVTGDDVTVTVNSASFADKNVGTGKAVS